MHFKNNLTLFAPDFGFLSLVSPHAAQTRWLFYLSEYAYTRQFQVLCYTLPPNSWGEKNIWEELGLNPCPRVPQETARPRRPWQHVQQFGSCKSLKSNVFIPMGDTNEFNNVYSVAFDAGEILKNNWATMSWAGR